VRARLPHTLQLALDVHGLALDAASAAPLLEVRAGPSLILTLPYINHGSRSCSRAPPAACPRSARCLREADTWRSAAGALAGPRPCRARAGGRGVAVGALAAARAPARAAGRPRRGACAPGAGSGGGRRGRRGWRRRPRGARGRGQRRRRGRCRARRAHRPAPAGNARVHSGCARPHTGPPPWLEIQLPPAAARPPAERARRPPLCGACAAGARIDQEVVAAAAGFPTLHRALAACAAPALAPAGERERPRARVFAASQVPPPAPRRAASRLRLAAGQGGRAVQLRAHPRPARGGSEASHANWLGGRARSGSLLLPGTQVLLTLDAAAAQGDAGLLDFVNWPAGAAALPAPVQRLLEAGVQAGAGGGAGGSAGGGGAGDASGAGDGGGRGADAAAAWADEEAAALAAQRAEARPRFVLLRTCLGPASQRRSRQLPPVDQRTVARRRCWALSTWPGPARHSGLNYHIMPYPNPLPRCCSVARAPSARPGPAVDACMQAAACSALPSWAERCTRGRSGRVWCTLPYCNPRPTAHRGRRAAGGAPRARGGDRGCGAAAAPRPPAGRAARAPGRGAAARQPAGPPFQRRGARARRPCVRRCARRGRARRRGRRRGAAPRRRRRAAAAERAAGAQAGPADAAAGAVRARRPAGAPPGAPMRLQPALGCRAAELWQRGHARGTKKSIEIFPPKTNPV